MPGDRGLMAPLKTNVKCKHFTRGKHCRRNVSSHFSPSTFRFYSNIAKAFRLAAFYVCFVKNIFWWAGSRGFCPKMQNTQLFRFFAFIPPVLLLLALVLVSPGSSYLCLAYSSAFSFCPSWQFQSRTFCCKPVGNNTESTQAFVSVACGIAHTPEVTTFKK